MILRQHCHEITNTYFELLQSGGVGFLSKADESRIKASFEQRARLLVGREIQQVDRYARMRSTELGQDCRNKAMEQPPYIANLERAAARLARRLRQPHRLFTLLQDGLGLRKQGRACV